MAFTTIKRGDYNDQSKEVQRLLNLSGIKTDTDGLYSDATYGAVSEFQDRHGLNVTGEVDELTWNELFKYNKPAGESTNAPTTKEEVKQPEPTTTPTGTITPETTVGGGEKKEDEKTSATTQAPADNSHVKYPFEKEFAYNDFTYDDFTYGDYVESDLVKQAEAALNAQLAQKPGAYQSQWQTQLNDTINKILNREKFSYDMNGDALYQQYKDKHIQQGKMAMQDAMGQAAAMTGGYGNSYAATVGNQAYQAQLNNLNDIVPELYQMALDRYKQEGNEMYQQYAMLGEQENMDYAKYQDTLAAWQAERDYLANRYDSERNYDYGKYQDDRNFEYGKYSDDRNLAYDMYANDKNYAYNEYLNAIEYDKWRQEMEYAKGRDQIKDEQWAAELAESVRQFDEQMAAKYPSGTESEVVPLTEEEKQNLIPTAAEYADKGEEELKSYLTELVATRGLTSEEANAIYETFFPTDRSGMTYSSASSESGFTGKTYEEAVAFLKEHGVSGASGIMTKSDWARRKASYNSTGTGSTEVTNYDSYEEYLADIVEYLIESNSNRGGLGGSF